MYRRSLVTGISLAIMACSLGLMRAGEPTTARGYYQRGLDHVRNNRYAEALADYTKAIELDAKFTNAYFSRSSLYSGHPMLDKRDYGKAVADLTKVLEIDPNEFSARFNRALGYESLRQYDKAIADYTKVIEGNTDFSKHGDGKDKCLALTHHYRGRVFQWHKQDNAMAAADYTEALRLDPKIEKVHYRRGQANNSLKEYAKAVADFTVKGTT